MPAHHALVDGISSLVGKDTGRETGDDLFHLIFSLDESHSGGIFKYVNARCISSSRARRDH